MLKHRLPLILSIFFSCVIALMSYRFLILGVPMAFPGMLGHIENRPLAFLLHISLAPLALLVGCLQLLPWLQAKLPGLHRWTGRIYGIAVLIAGISGLVVALGAEGGVVASIGFGVLAVTWLYVTTRGIVHAMAHEVVEHRRWMIRSFALTFAGVTLRLQLPGFFLAGLEYAEASIFVAWTCWVPNLVIAEWWLRHRSVLHQ